MQKANAFAAKMKQDPKVTADLAGGILAEEARMRDARKDYVEQMKLKRENALAKKALAETDRQLKKRKQDLKHQDKVLAAMTASRAYTLAMLRDKHKKGGAREHAKNRSKVLEQVREVGELSPEQTFQWSCFKTAWDESMGGFS